MSRPERVIRVVLADDHPVTREGIRTVLQQAPDILIVGEATDGYEAQRMVAELCPDVLLLDLVMPGLRPSEIERQIEIKYDSAETWYTGTGNPASDQLDAWSVAAHEFGHALGLDHTQLTYCPGTVNDPSRATMCSGYSTGLTYKRSLELDDRTGVTVAYP